MGGDDFVKETPASNGNSATTAATNARGQVIADVVTLLQYHSIKVVVFDMDQTAVAMHSRGRLRRDQVRRVGQILSGLAAKNSTKS